MYATIRQFSCRRSHESSGLHRIQIFEVINKKKDKQPRGCGVPSWVPNGFCQKAWTRAHRLDDMVITRGTTLVSWGWTINQDTNKGFNGSKSHIFNFSRFLGVKTVSVLVHKKNWSMLEISCCRPLQWALDGICL